ncbi:hypothetical protein CHS0354_010571 [Potamilus streckersoni]|uniref:C-type lectin domain-containing protein n=1 Tax=Potamilus streckersoni TaxID=2493646 RepID=A0AAE0S5W3_9BIVA|nr:hypothetical protein CHS0354_010571 [Potamilus streckersoni]
MNLYPGYMWSDGSALAYTRWSQDEPNDLNGNEKCVECWKYDMLWNDNNCYKSIGFICKKARGVDGLATEVMETTTEPGLWADEDCGTKLPFVCKRRYSKVTPLPSAPTQMVVGGCPPDFFIFGSKCFLIRSTARYDFDTARNSCIQYGTGFTLASINSRLEQMFLVLYMRETGGSSAFIGLNDLQENGRYDWLDNSPVSYINFRAGQPSLHARENCVEMFSDGTWNNLNCASLRGFICQGPRDKNFTEPTPTVPTSHCPAGYTVYPITEQCYRILNSSQSWNESLTLCQADGATLATISDLYDMYFLELLSNAKARNEASLWIGLSEFKGTGVFRWISGATVTYTKWDYGEPRLQENMCVAIHKGVWKQVSCESSQPAICQTVRESTDVSRKTTKSTQQVECSNSSVVFGTKCYLVVLDMPVDWFTAQDMCRDSGMKIASIHSLQESEFIKNLILARYRDSPVKSVWIGLVESPNEGWFIWTDKTPINFFNWDDKEPNMNNETLACAELYALTGSWYDDDCFARKGFVCKGDPAPLVSTNESSSMITVTGPSQLYDGSNAAYSIAKSEKCVNKHKEKMPLTHNIEHGDGFRAVLLICPFMVEVSYSSMLIQRAMRAIHTMYRCDCPDDFSYSLPQRPAQEIDNFLQKRVEVIVCK